MAGLRHHRALILVAIPFWVPFAFAQVPKGVF